MRTDFEPDIRVLLLHEGTNTEFELHGFCAMSSEILRIENAAITGANYGSVHIGDYGKSGREQCNALHDVGEVFEERRHGGTVEAEGNRQDDVFALHGGVEIFFEGGKRNQWSRNDTVRRTVQACDCQISERCQVRSQR